MDLLDLRTSLETTLVDVLGVYRLGNNSITPAIAVRSEGEKLPAGIRVSGLECVILRTPVLKKVRQYRKAPARATWIVYLIDWEGSGLVEEGARALLMDWPGAELFEMRVAEGLGPKAQMRVEIKL